MERELECDWYDRDIVPIINQKTVKMFMIHFLTSLTMRTLIAKQVIMMKIMIRDIYIYIVCTHIV